MSSLDDITITGRTVGDGYSLDLYCRCGWALPLGFTGVTPTMAQVARAAEHDCKWSDFQKHGCRVYWGHCGCDLFRDHEGPHVGLHFSEDNTEVTDTHVMARDYPHLFGEDAPDG